MYFLTTTIDEPGLANLIDESVANFNSDFRKHQPFGIVVREEPIDPANMPDVMVTTFYLVVTGDVTIKNGDQALKFTHAMFSALKEVSRLNKSNCVVSHPKKKFGFD